MASSTASTGRTRVRRAPEKQEHHVAARDAVLAAPLSGVVVAVEDDRPFALPVAVAPDTDPATGGTRLRVHGSPGSRLFRLPAAGVVPLRQVWGVPRPAPDHAFPVRVPDHVAPWSEGRA